MSDATTILPVKRWVIPGLDENTYLVWSQSKQAILIDPGAVDERIDAFIEAEALQVQAIFLTHAHADHIGGVPAYAKKFGVNVWLGKKEQVLALDPQQNLTAWMDRNIRLQADEYFPEDGGKLTMIDLKWQVFETPGHTSGSVSLRLPVLNLVFSGDVLFSGSIGRSDLPTGDSAELVKSIREKLYTLPDKTVVLSGHGEPTTIGREKVSNPYVRL